MTKVLPTISDRSRQLLRAGLPANVYQKFLEAQNVSRTRAGVATGKNGAVTVAYNGLAARVGLEALNRGGGAMDAAMTAAVMQIALTGGAPVSYFGIMSLVYYEAASGRVHTMDAGWNTIRHERSPRTIPGLSFGYSLQAMRGTLPSGRTALVGGFMKGVESAHSRFGRLPLCDLFEPAIDAAESGIPVSPFLANHLAFRSAELQRLPETKAVFTKSDGSNYVAGDLFRQPALAKTLQAVAANGSDYMYRGPWANRLVAAVRAEGGQITAEDLASYDVAWEEPLISKIGDFEIYTTRPPNRGGVAMIEAQHLARSSGLVSDGHWTQSAVALRKAVDISLMAFSSYLTDDLRQQLFPGLDFSTESRITSEHANQLWARMKSGAVSPYRYFIPSTRHSDNVVAIDRDGNIVALTHTINCVLWGRTALFVDGVSIGDPASFSHQQVLIEKVGPGKRLPSSTETGILFEHGKPLLGFASMGSGLHQRTMLALLNVMAFGMSVQDAIDSPDFYLPRFDPSTNSITMMVPKGRFSKQLLNAVGYPFEEVDSEFARFAGEGIWVAVSRDEATRRLHAASHNRTNSAAVAF